MARAEIAKREGEVMEPADNHYRDTFSSLQTIPGIGSKTAIALTQVVAQIPYPFFKKIIYDYTRLLMRLKFPCRLYLPM